MKRSAQLAACAVFAVAALTLSASSLVVPSAVHAQAAPFAIAAPAPGAVIQGTYTFAVSAGNTGRVASVEYAIGSKKLGIADAPPFALTWNTGYASDGSYALQAAARDAFGNVVGRAEQIFVINNHGNSLQVTSPDLGQTLSGTVNLTITGSDSQFYPALWMLNIDGEDQSDFWTDTPTLGGRSPNTVTISLNTTRFPNGRHELYIAMHSNHYPAGTPGQASWYNWRAAFERVVNIDNGHALMDIAPNYLHVYLTEGQQLGLTCRRLFADQTSAPCVAPSYSSGDPTVVAVSRTGMLGAGQSEGFSTITVSDSGKTTYARVWVRTSLNIPHFSGSGQMLSSYNRKSSLFVVSPFTLQPSDLESDPELLRQTRIAGVNTLSRGVYLNPRRTNYDYNTWQSTYDRLMAPDWQFAASSGFHILATGDDIARNIGQEAWWTLNWPFARKAVQHAVQTLADSGVAISIDMVDEASMLWGSTPKPPGRIGDPGSFTAISCAGSTCHVLWPNNPVNSSRFPSGLNFALGGSHNPGLNTPGGQLFSATNIAPDSFDFMPAAPLVGTFTAANDPNLQFIWWAGDLQGCPSQPCNPSVPNDALAVITSWVKTAPQTVPVSWPALGIAPPAVQANWMGPNGISDYASYYWDTLKLRHTYTWSGGVQDLAYWMRTLFYERQPGTMLDRPQLLLSSISGPFYIKNTAGAAYYSPPADTLEQPGVDGKDVTSGIITAAALGAAGVRLYVFESPSGLGGRRNAALGTELQTGASPTAGDRIATSNWLAIAYAANPLTKTLAPYVLGQALSSPAFDRNVVTAARQGPNGRMLMVVNDNDWDRNLAIDFTPYKYGYEITRYRITSNGIETAVIPNMDGETIDLQAGETVVYLFPSVPLASFTRPTRFVAPPRARDKAILHYSYLYAQTLPQQVDGIDCTSGCTVDLDQSLGNVYYQFTYLDSADNVMSRGSIRVLTPPATP